MTAELRDPFCRQLEGSGTMIRTADGERERAAGSQVRPTRRGGGRGGGCCITLVTVQHNLACSTMSLCDMLKGVQ